MGDLNPYTGLHYSIMTMDEWQVPTTVFAVDDAARKEVHNMNLYRIYKVELETSGERKGQLKSAELVGDCVLASSMTQAVIDWTAKNGPFPDGSPILRAETITLTAVC